MKIQSLGKVSRRDPHVHCGDLCGRGCSFNEFMSAQEGAYRAELRMPGWEGHVWENMGWFWRLERKAGDVTWNLALNTRGLWECYSYGASQQVWTIGYADPDDAVAAAVNALTQQVARVSRDIHALTGKQL